MGAKKVCTSLKIQKINTMCDRALLRKLRGPAKGGWLQKTVPHTIQFHSRAALTYSYLNANVPMWEALVFTSFIIVFGMTQWGRYLMT